MALTGNELIKGELKCNLTHEHQLSEVWIEGGLTVRQHFASLAMQGYFANPNPGTIAEVVRDSVYAADLLIEALNKESEVSNG